MMMRHVMTILLLAANALACGPYFPSSYLSNDDAYFIENLNLPEELGLIAKEYGLIDSAFYSKGQYASAEAERMDFTAKATQLGGLELKDEFVTYAKAVRAGDTNAIAPAVPEHLEEFVLYLEGIAAFRSDPDLMRPKAWDRLLELDFSNRLYRTVWVYYMQGNLAASHDAPDAASEYYAACRAASEETRKDYLLGLAHASYKRDYLAQTNLTKRLERGIAAVGYYHRAFDPNQTRFCMDHLRLDIEKAAEAELTDPSMAILEAMAVFNIGKEHFIETLENYPDLKISPRLAWFMYKQGEIDKAAAYLKHCPEKDMLANWLRYRLAQRQGRTQEAIDQLKKWVDELRVTQRIEFELSYREPVSQQSAIHGNLGTLFATQGQMMDALVSFVEAGAYMDAALIAERYVSTDELKRYVNTFSHRAVYAASGEFNNYYNTETQPVNLQLRLSYLLARRLFREGRIEEAIPYYPPEITKTLQSYLDARKKADNRFNTPNVRAAHLYHAARILRWKGMELCGTELHPDYTVVNGLFSWVGMDEEDSIFPDESAALYDQSAPVPNVRFHYRQRAADLAGRAAALSWDRHQKAMMLWSAGTWIKDRNPEDADVHYKKLARLPFQPLAKTADEKRWFPESSPMMDYVFRSEGYLPPKSIAKAARNYDIDQ